MNDDELFARLHRADPANGASIDPVDGPAAAHLMEQIMQTTPEVPTAPAAPSRPRRRWPALLAGGVAAVAIVGGAVWFAAGGDSDEAATSVSYSLPASDPMTAMCLPVTDYQPAPGLVGFRGTVSAVGDGTVTLDVTDWYAGGDADQVVLATGDVPIMALDGVEFVQGGDYLVAVQDGQVVICGISGQYSPELATLYDQWFGR